jgi:hypothetical protein
MLTCSMLSLLLRRRYGHSYCIADVWMTLPNYSHPYLPLRVMISSCDRILVYGLFGAEQMILAILL